MPVFRVSQAELWHRVYTIEAETLEQAKNIYKNHLDTGDEGGISIRDPEYLEDLDDIEWSEA